MGAHAFPVHPCKPQTSLNRVHPEIVFVYQSQGSVLPEWKSLRVREQPSSRAALGSGDAVVPLPPSTLTEKGGSVQLLFRYLCQQDNLLGGF